MEVISNDPINFLPLTFIPDNVTLSHETIYRAKWTKQQLVFLKLYFVKACDNACGMKLPIPSHGKIWDNNLIQFYGEYYCSKDKNNNQFKWHNYKRLWHKEGSKVELPPHIYFFFIIGEALNAMVKHTIKGAKYKVLGF